MSEAELEAKVNECLCRLNNIAVAIQKLANAVENLALQTTNNQVENRKALDAIKSGVLDTNLAVKYPNN